MRSGQLLLIVGLILAGIGVAGWVFVTPYMVYYQGERLIDEVAFYNYMNACAIGVTVIGGGLTVGGLIKMILGRWE